MKRVFALAAFQILVMLAWAAQNEYVRATAPTFRIPLEPRDPYDLLRGRYFVMNPRDSRIEIGDAGVMLTADDVKRFLGTETTFHGTALVGFCPQGESQRVCALAKENEPAANGPARFWSRARLSIFWRSEAWNSPPRPAVHPPNYSVGVDLALDRFFLPNRTVLPARENEAGWEVEVCHRPGLTPLPKRLLFKGAPVLAD